MPYTLLETAKLSTDPLKKGVIETIARESELLARMPFKSINGTALKFNREGQLQSATWRQVNQSYSAQSAVLDPRVEQLFVAGGLSTVDRVQVIAEGNTNSVRATYDALFVKGIKKDIEDKLINGDNSADPAVPNGLKVRCENSGQIIEADSGASYALTLAKVDELLDMVSGGADYLLMNKYCRRKVSSLVRAAGQAIETVSGAFGRLLPAYAGVPIIPLETNSQDEEILPFTESNLDSGNASTSLYALRLGEDYFCGLNAGGGLAVMDQGLVGTMYTTVIEWVLGWCDFSPKAVARLHGVKQL